MKLSKFLIIIGTLLWLALGIVVYFLSVLGNSEATLVWASTIGILIILALALSLKKEEDVEELKGVKKWK